MRLGDRLPPPALTAGVATVATAVVPPPMQVALPAALARVQRIATHAGVRTRGQGPARQLPDRRCRGSNSTSQGSPAHSASGPPRAASKSPARRRRSTWQRPEARVLPVPRPIDVARTATRSDASGGPGRRVARSPAPHCRSTRSATAALLQLAVVVAAVVVAVVVAVVASPLRQTTGRRTTPSAAPSHGDPTDPPPTTPLSLGRRHPSPCGDSRARRGVRNPSPPPQPTVPLRPVPQRRRSRSSSPSQPAPCRRGRAWGTSPIPAPRRHRQRGWPALWHPYQHRRQHRRQHLWWPLSRPSLSVSWATGRSAALGVSGCAPSPPARTWVRSATVCCGVGLPPSRWGPVTRSPPPSVPVAATTTTTMTGRITSWRWPM